MNTPQKLAMGALASAILTAACVVAWLINDYDPLYKMASTGAAFLTVVLLGAALEEWLDG
jgi:hypothetical protein